MYAPRTRTENLLNQAGGRQGVNVKTSLSNIIHTLAAHSHGTVSVPVAYLPTSPYVGAHENPYKVVLQALVAALHALKVEKVLLLDVGRAPSRASKRAAMRMTERLQKKSLKRTRLGLPKITYSFS